MLSHAVTGQTAKSRIAQPRHCAMRSRLIYSVGVCDERAMGRPCDQRGVNAHGRRLSLRGFASCALLHQHGRVLAELRLLSAEEEVRRMHVELERLLIRAGLVDRARVSGEGIA